MKYLLIFILVFQSLFCLANSASPYIGGTTAGSAFSSRDVDILSEKISIDIDPHFYTALFKIVYNIKIDKEGKQMPLLFYAVDYQSFFKVWVDGKPVDIMGLPEKYTDTAAAFVKKFGASYGVDSTYVKWDKASGNYYKSSDLKYFEASLTKGAHIIRVEYVASGSSRRDAWIKPYTFSYSLAPAKYWRSYGSLEILVNTHHSENSVESDLGYPQTKTDSIYSWKFSKLPADAFEINYIPKVSWFANLLLDLGPGGITLGFGLVMLVLHINWMYRYRKARPLHKHSPVVHLGGIFIPFIVLFFFWFSYNIIEWAIGNSAGTMQSAYLMIFIMFLYIVTMPVYWIIVCIIDNVVIKKLKLK